MDTKTCTKCDETKPLSEYYKSTGRPMGVHSSCKVCQTEVNKASRLKYLEARREYCRNYSKGYYERNREDVLKRRPVYNAKYYEKNKEYYAEYSREWRKNNGGRVKAYKAKRRASKMNATPTWLSTEQEDQINKIYSFRHAISGVVDREYHVDHIVPLQGENVCGLHVPWNLQVIPAEDNISKSNNYNDW